MKYSTKLFLGLVIIGYPFARFMDTNISQVAEVMSPPYITGLIIALVYGALMFTVVFIGEKIEK